MHMAIVGEGWCSADWRSHCRGAGRCCAVSRDTHMVFSTAYVPVAESGRKVLRLPPVRGCHGPNLDGLGTGLLLAGRSPS